MLTIISYVSNYYPSNIWEKYFNFVKEFDSTNWNWRDFVQNLSDWIQNNEKNFKVTMSSSWAICQELLGNIEGNDLKYAQERGGIWSMNNNEIISVRTVLSDIQKNYP